MASVLRPNPLNLEMRFLVEMSAGYEIKLAKIKFHRYVSAATFGWQWALKRAQQLRDAAVQRFQYVKRWDYISKAKTNARTGLVPGIRLIVEPRSDGNLPRAQMVADYKTEGGLLKIKAFGIRKFGYKAAYAKAKEFRARYVPGVDLQEATCPIPTLGQYRLIMNLASDVPSPQITE